MLTPGAELVFPFTATPPARPVVHCQQEMFTSRIQLKLLLNRYVLKNKNVEFVYASQ
jgi:hypothetical protein